MKILRCGECIVHTADLAGLMTERHASELLLDVVRRHVEQRLLSIRRHETAIHVRRLKLPARLREVIRNTRKSIAELSRKRIWSGKRILSGELLRELTESILLRWCRKLIVKIAREAVLLGVLLRGAVLRKCALRGESVVERALTKRIGLLLLLKLRLAKHGVLREGGIEPSVLCVWRKLRIR